LRDSSPKLAARHHDCPRAGAQASDRLRCFLRSCRRVDAGLIDSTKSAGKCVSRSYRVFTTIVGRNQSRYHPSMRRASLCACRGLMTINETAEAINIAKIITSTISSFSKPGQSLPGWVEAGTTHQPRLLFGSRNRPPTSSVPTDGLRETYFATRPHCDVIRFQNGLPISTCCLVNTGT
jgi:hypothetical protein